jgi:2-desacetyl-2-hydroxyethyl bacteriochlorophyllide A dehydrogenase
MNAHDDMQAPATALWYVDRGQAELRQETIAAPKPDEVLVRAHFGAISRGTERLIYSGRMPSSEYERMRCPRMAGSFPFPVKYGYASVGRVEAGAAQLLDRVVFCLHPHQTLFTLPVAGALPVPDHVPATRAVLAANMETALNAVWDARPSPADRIAVVGAGVVGLLTAYLCGRMPGAQVTVVDVAPSRAAVAKGLGVHFAMPEKAPRDCDVVFHASGTESGLATALGLAGDEATIVELSWYGTGDVAAPLGGEFHSRRLRLISSQVGKVAPSHRPRWTTQRRLAAAIGLLDDPALDALLSPAYKFEELPKSLPSILSAHSDVICPVIAYPSAAGAS